MNVLRAGKMRKHGFEGEVIQHSILASWKYHYNPGHPSAFACAKRHMNVDVAPRTPSSIAHVTTLDCTRACVVVGEPAAANGETVCIWPGRSALHAYLERSQLLSRPMSLTAHAWRASFSLNPPLVPSHAPAPRKLARACP